MTASPLRAALDAVIAEQGCSLKDLTVLAAQNDPFRLDTQARHRDGEWLAITARALGLGDRQIHLRGLHYMVLGRQKPDSNRTPYANTDEDWTWLQSDAGKAARFLGYIPFDQITDQRNAMPVIREFEPPLPSAFLSTELQVEIPYDITPTLYTDDFRGTQPYKLVMVGEKSSLEPILSPVAADYEADLYLPTGEISDTQIYRWPPPRSRTAGRSWCSTSPTATRPAGRCRSRSPASSRRSANCSAGSSSRFTAWR